MEYRMDVQADSPPGRTHLTMLSTDIRTGSRRCFSSACGLDREIFSEFVEMALYRGPSKCAVSQANYRCNFEAHPEPHAWFRRQWPRRAVCKGVYRMPKPIRYPLPMTAETVLQWGQVPPLMG
jgi:hypothetical protein